MAALPPIKNGKVQLMPVPANSHPSTLDILKRTDKTEMGVYAIMIVVNLANVGLVMIKGVAAYVSSSFSIGTSAIESFGDVFVSILLLVQYMLDKRVKKSEYPRGRSSESTTNLTAAVVMMALASVNFIQSFDALITGSLEPEFTGAHLVVVGVNIGVKIFLFFICLLKSKNNQINVLMRDQLTDVFTNSVALIAVTCAFVYKKECDFVGASIIFLLIIRNWVPIVNDAWFKLQGVKGDDEINEEVSKILADNRHLFSELSGYITYHIGNKVIVEIYTKVVSFQKRAEIFSKFDDVKYHSVYIMPVEEAKDVNLLTVKMDDQKASKKIEETEKLLKNV